MNGQNGGASPDNGFVQARRIMARLDELAGCSDTPDGITRLFLSPAHRQAADRVCAWMAEAGMATMVDAIGNAVGRYEGERAGARTLILGSHIDSVRNAGRYDGCLGVILAIEAVAALAAAGRRLPFAIEVLAFGDEEGVRFPEALAGSRAVAGCFDPAVLSVTDESGTTLAAALKRFGCEPELIAALARHPAGTLGYFEIHIEQGPVLEAEDLPVGVVDAIAGASRFRVSLEGLAGHAGTVPMDLRQDAFAALAAMAMSLEALARATPGLVGTIGRVEVQPGAVNVIPGAARFTVDLRSPEDAVRQAAIAAMRASFGAIARRRNVALTIESFYDEAAVRCAPFFREALGRAIARAGWPVRELTSGAGHDGLAMQALCPIGMMFVRCAGGISHNPRERVEDADVAAAFRVLTRLLQDLAAKDRASSP